MWILLWTLMGCGEEADKSQQTNDDSTLDTDDTALELDTDDTVDTASFEDTGIQTDSGENSDEEDSGEETCEPQYMTQIHSRLEL